MKEFIFTSPLMSGSIRLAFDDNGLLTRFENNAALTQEQKAFIYSLDVFPIHESRLTVMMGKKGTIQEVTDLTFERFWEEYAYKKGKVKAIAEWNRLNAGDRAKAIAAIKAYRFDCKAHNREMVYAERYLKYRRFDDE